MQPFTRRTFVAVAASLAAFSILAVAQGQAKPADPLESGTVWEGTYNRVKVLA